MKEDLILAQEEREKVILVGVDTGEEEDFSRSMDELASLADACMMQVVGIVVQRMECVNKALYIGSGKVAEVKEFANTREAELVTERRSSFSLPISTAGTGYCGYGQNQSDTGYFCYQSPVTGSKITG